ncbi:hypothetical protein ACFZA1_41610 [Streptomyces filipinensis]|uniref:hypothetical protein n=1 Tax=Streptomyces filipinensis TaxID=66887 RepID=UPI0036EFEE99
MTSRRSFVGGATAVGATALLTNLSSSPASAAPVAGAVSVTDARAKILAVNAGMRTRYKALKDELQKHLAPVIVVANGPEGGTYWLVENGQVIEQVYPVDQIFQLAKSIAHVPLGTFSVIAPYLNKRVPDWHQKAGDMDAHDLEMVSFNGPGSEDWVEPLRQWGDVLAAGRAVLEDADLPDKLFKSSAHILDGASEFIAEAVRTRSFSMKKFEDFTGAVYGDIRTNMYFAAKAQIDGVTALLTRWKNQLGAAKWHDLYTLVYSMWTTSVLNQNTIIIRHFMDADRVGTHLIDIVCDQLPVTDPIGVGLENLARIVQDNIAAEMVFSADQKVANALKGREDLLSQELLGLLGDDASTFGTPGVALTCPVQH